MATSALQQTNPASTPPTASEVPDLENGDQLTAAEFLRRYEAAPDLKKAQLIGNYSGRQNELQNGGQDPRSSLFGEPSMAAFNASKRLFFCLRIVDR